jgi:diguanylate cyclase (GGDEF)-like protein/PAS domain S-box-containing protein
MLETDKNGLPETALKDQIKRLTAENNRLRMQLHSTTRQVSELNEFIQIMLNLSPFSICIIQDDQWIYTNKAFCETVERTPRELRDINPWDFVFQADREHVRKSVRAMLDGEAESFFMFRIFTNEKIKWILGSVAYIHMNEKRAVLGNFVDLTEGRVMQLAYSDALTGLPNRKLMMDRLEQAIVTAKRRSNSRLGLLFIDLDAFKEVNDRHGHEVGDKLLIEIAHGLKDVVRRENDTIARIGGDEFIILLTDVSQTESIDWILRHLFERFSSPVPIPGKNLEIPVSFSIGIAVFPDHGEDSDTLIRHADEAMYCVKKTPGKNSFQFYRP